MNWFLYDIGLRHERVKANRKSIGSYKNDTGYFQNKFPEISQNLQENICAQMFSCEFCEISKNTFFTEHLRTTASEMG